jgi:hypothetical protein
MPLPYQADELCRMCSCGMCVSLPGRAGSQGGRVPSQALERCHCSHDERRSPGQRRSEAHAICPLGGLFTAIRLRWVPACQLAACAVVGAVLVCAQGYLLVGCSFPPSANCSYSRNLWVNAG